MSNGNAFTVGWREWLALPDLGLLAVRAKIDTGAETSSLHAESTFLGERDGVEWIEFTTQPLWGTPVVCEAPVHDRREVVSSNGKAEERIVIRTTLRLGLNVGASAWRAEVTLADRTSMRFPMLLGREAMVGRVLVDPSASFLLGDVEADPGDFYS